MSELVNRTRIKAALSAGASGLNTLPDWIENYAIGTAPTGAPIYDTVHFSLLDPVPPDYSDPLYLGNEEGYYRTTISVSNNTQIVKTLINGRKNGSVKQLIAQGDYNVSFDITIMSPTYPTAPINDNITINPVGRGLSGTYMGNYHPNSEMQKIINFFNIFYDDNTYSHVNVFSSYLTTIFGITKIIPYSIVTSQNHQVSNAYRIKIQALSDFSDDNTSNEIIPNV